jgi:hypothetical protein
VDARNIGEFNDAVLQTAMYGHDGKGATAQNEKRHATRKLIFSLDKIVSCESLFE